MTDRCDPALLTNRSPPSHSDAPVVCRTAVAGFDMKRNLPLNRPEHISTARQCRAHDTWELYPNVKAKPAQNPKQFGATEPQLENLFADDNLAISPK